MRCRGRPADTVPDAPCLLDLLEAHSGIVCAIGAGGKKSVLNALAGMHPGRVALTASVGTTRFPELPHFEVVIDEDAALEARVKAIDRDASVAYACPSEHAGRYAGATLATIERIHSGGGFEVSYVKADGARMRWIKAPDEDEPVLPARCSTVIAVVSARAIGEPLDARVAHRIEQLRRVTGLGTGERITPEHVGRLMAHPAGLMKAPAGCRVVAVINMVDDARREVLAREAAAAALALGPRLARVVLTQLKRPEGPLVAVVER